MHEIKLEVTIVVSHVKFAENLLCTTFHVQFISYRIRSNYRTVFLSLFFFSEKIVVKYLSNTGTR